MLELNPILSIPDLRREERRESVDEDSVTELGIVRGGAIFAVPDAPVRVLGSGRRGRGREPMAERGEAVLTVGGRRAVVDVGEDVPVKRMEPMVSVAAMRQVWIVMGVPSSA